MKDIDPKVEEAVDRLNLGPLARRRLLTGGGLVSASLAASALLAGCGEAAEQEGGTGAGDFPETPKWKFVFVNHVTTNEFFVPTKYGFEDACALLGIEKAQWTGSETSSANQMVNAINAAVSSKADGLAVAVTEPRAFAGPIDKALDAGIPVLSYNADGEAGNPGTNRLSYVGQDLFVSGQQLGERIADMAEPGPVVGFIATPGQLNIQPRIDGAEQALKDSDKDFTFEPIATGTELPEELSRIDSYYQGHKDVTAMLAVDAGSTQVLGDVMTKYSLKDEGVAAGGFDLVTKTLNHIKQGNLDFTIDQQPYLQGFLPVLYLYLYKLSGGLVTPPETNTGLAFVTVDTVDPYLDSKTRFEGSDTAQKLIERSGAIPHE